MVSLFNGLFPGHSFPISDKVEPLFIGFTSDAETIKTHIDYFRRYQPIGCRDTHTRSVFAEFGVDAYVSGCLTMTLPPRIPRPPGVEKKLLVIYGSGTGSLPATVLKHIPPYLLDTAEFVFHRMPVMCFPLSSFQCLEIERYAEAILQDYAERATLVLTPLLHVASPCLGLGIPTVVCRTNSDKRFSYLSEMLPIFVPGQFEAINWNPDPIPVHTIRTDLERRVRDSLSGAR
jgi:hypothetical protein